MPTPLRTPQTSGHSSFRVSKFTSVVTQIATKSWIKNHHFLFVPE